MKTFLVEIGIIIIWDWYLKVLFISNKNIKRKVGRVGAGGGGVSVSVGSDVGNKILCMRERERRKGKVGYNVGGWIWK